MKKIQTIGIISDTHDNLPNVHIAVNIFNGNKVSLVIHCGDFVAPFTLVAFKELQCPLIGVFGNCDGEQKYLLTQARNFDFSIHQPPFVTNINDKIVFITHKPMLPEIKTDILLYGHTHKPIVKHGSSKHGPKLIINPGEASGWLYNKPTIAILNVEKNQVEIIPL